MAVRMNDDSPALKSVFNINRNFGSATQNLQRLSSGLRVSRAADDPGSVGVIQRLNSDVASQSTALQNINTAAPQIQTVDSALSSQQDVLIRGRQLALQAANGTNDPATTNAINAEFQTLVSAPAGQTSEFQRIAETTEVAGQDLTAASRTVTVQAGTTAGPESRVDVTVPQSTQASRGLNGLDVSTTAGAQNAITQIDTAMGAISQDRASIGASQNQLEFRTQGLENQLVNTSAARSSIADVDVATEISRFTRNRIVGQAGTAALAQFNRLRGSAMRLLG